MNEQIKELAEQCTENVDDGGYGYDVFDKEKFAELIIRECIEQIETCFSGGSVSMDDKPIWGPSVDTFKAWNWALKRSKKHIKEVFGVE